MAERQIRFDDGASYERMMGRWSQLAGDVFLDWLAPPPGLRWLDVGCGNGAFTERIVERCAPATVLGIDPSEDQLAFARKRPAARIAEFRQGDAMSLGATDNSFDAAVMALVIFFVPEPAKGVAEMTRVVRPGGIVTSYTWDILGGGFPLDALFAVMRAGGMRPILPPSAEASRMTALVQLWKDAGLEAIETREITVSRTFADFEDLWSTSIQSSSIKAKFASMAPADVELLKAGLRERMPPGADGRITYPARANAVKGKVAQ
jgi:SAM-dependent methyltransferase